MPSGFQQDPNQLQPAFFRVVINMTNQYNYWTNNNHPTATGSVQPYAWDNFTGNDQPATVIAGQTLARGNLRFQRIIEELTKYADAQIIDLEALSGTDPVTGNNLANHLAFTVKYERFGIDAQGIDGDSPLLAMERAYLKSINGGSTSSPYDGENINNTNEAIQEAIMRALIESVTRSVRVFVPQEGSDPIVGEGTQQSVTINDVTYGEDENSYSDLRDTIVVNVMDGTTLISTDNNADVAP
jgi:hypothetical protein